MNPEHHDAFHEKVEVSPRSDGRGASSSNVEQVPASKSALPPPGDTPDDTDYRNPEMPSDAVTWTKEAELSAELAPDVKAEILRQGAGKRDLRIKRRDVAAAEAFFDTNPMWTGTHLLGLWQRCCRFGEASVEGRDPLWHARRGGDFKFLLLNLAKVVRQLGIGDKVPQLIAVPREKLYKPRRPRNRKSNKVEDNEKF